MVAGVAAQQPLDRACADSEAGGPRFATTRMSVAGVSTDAFLVAKLSTQRTLLGPLGAALPASFTTRLAFYARWLLMAISLST